MLYKNLCACVTWKNSQRNSTHHIISQKTQECIDSICYGDRIEPLSDSKAALPVPVTAEAWGSPWAKPAPKKSHLQVLL